MTTKANADCRTALCQYDSAPRTKFFNGMVLSDEHLRAEQRYHREALRRINRYMWGSGIVCGLEVEKVGFCLKVHPGFALDCEGNAIEVCRCITIDLAELCKDRFPGGCAPVGLGQIDRCLTIRYKELEDGSVAVSGSGDDCAGRGKPRSQPSRVREGFCLEFVEAEKCPDTDCTDDDQGVIQLMKRVLDPNPRQHRVEGDECMSRTPECPACDCNGDDCAVCLAEISIDCEKREVVGNIKGACRRYVWTSQFLRRLAALTGAGVVAQSERQQDEPERMRRAIDERPEQAPAPTTGRGRRASGTRQSASGGEDSRE